jgi:CheY-specific phosphatase CheX
MNPQCQTAMRGAISKVLETMFFTMVLYEGADELQTGEVPPYDFESSIMIHGDSQEITFFCLSTDRFARMITGNFLGVEENELSVAEIGDTMKELANMAAGELVAKFSQGAWRLDIPEFEELKPSFKHYPGKGMASLRLYDEDGPLALALCRWVEGGE